MSSIPSLSGGNFFSRPLAHVSNPTSIQPDSPTKIANEPCPDDLKQDLTEWCNDCDINKAEKKIRKYVAETIKSHYAREKRQSFSFAAFRITRLPNLSLIAMLDFLNLQDNFLTSFDAQNLPMLKHLYLSGNKLTLFNGRHLPALIFIDLEKNSFTSLSQITLPPMPNALKWVYLKGNPLEQAKWKEVTMKVRSGVIQDLPEDDLETLFGVKILRNPQNTLTPDNSPRENASRKKTTIQKWLEEVTKTDPASIPEHNVETADQS